MILKTTYTHKGWFFLCPVYLNADHGEGMDVSARHKLLDFWFDINQLIFDFLCAFSTYDEPFPFKVTGKLDKPIEITTEI